VYSLLIITVLAGAVQPIFYIHTKIGGKVTKKKLNTQIIPRKCEIFLIFGRFKAKNQGW
jgi:hypothetical protein